jgi:predicted outer membrane repeat protein
LDKLFYWEKKVRVGLFFENYSAQSGGAFAFQDSILAALLKTKQSKHEFYIFYYGEKKYENINNIFLTFIQLNKHIGIAKKIRNKLKKILYHISTENESLAKAALAYNVELMYFPTPAYLPVSVPFIYTVWDLAHRIHPYFPEVSTSGWTWEQRETLYHSVLPKASRIISGSELGKKQIIKFYAIQDDLVKVLPFPTPDFALRQNNLKSELLQHFNIGAPYLFYPAQFWPHKNHIILLHVLKKLYEKYSVPFHLVFSGSDKGNLHYIKEQVQKLNLSGKVHFLGFVTQMDLIALYQNAFALVFPSFFGPDNLPPLEALALGCPVIASRSSVVEDQLGDAALLFNPKNEDEILDAVYSLYTDRLLLEKLVQKGKALANKWTSAEYIQGILSIIDEFGDYRRCWSTKDEYIHL